MIPAISMGYRHSCGSRNPGSEILSLALDPRFRATAFTHPGTAKNPASRRQDTSAPLMGGGSGWG
jgi:hypothetical protein